MKLLTRKHIRHPRVSVYHLPAPSKGCQLNYTLRDGELIPWNGTIWRPFEGANMYICMLYAWFSGSSPITWSTIPSFDQKPSLGSCLSTVDRFSPPKMLPFMKIGNKWLKFIYPLCFHQVFFLATHKLVILQVFSNHLLVCIKSFQQFLTWHLLGPQTCAGVFVALPKSGNCCTGRRSSSATLEEKRWRFSLTSWWFQPLWKILVKMETFPR